MHDIWNPWHGCKKCSEGCENCYMYYLDDMRDKDGAEVYLEEADQWRGEAWDIMRMRSDVIFILVTKRPERIPLLLELPFKHKGIYVAPILGPVSSGEIWIPSARNWQYE